MAAAVIFAAAWLVLTPSAPRAAPLTATTLALQDEDIRPRELKQLEELREEVRMLALFEQAKITPQQAASLLDIISRASHALKELTAQHQDLLADAKQCLNECRSLLAKGKPLSDELRRKSEMLQRSTSELLQALGRQFAPLLTEAGTVLSDEQVQALAAPARPDVWGPLRQQLEQGIRQIRTLSEDEFELHVPDLLDQHLARISDRFGVKLKPEDYQTENKRIMELLREARTLDDDDLRIRSATIVSKILSEGRLGEFGRMAAAQLQPGGTDTEGLGKLLFHPIAIRALKALRDGERER